MKSELFDGVLFEDFNTQQNENLLNQINNPIRGSKNVWRNLDEFGTFRYIQPYDIPELKPYNGLIPLDLVAYCDIGRAHRCSCPHFYIDDNRLPMMGNHIEHFTERLRRFNYVIAPDYTMYCGAPLPVNLRSLYLNRSIAAYWQEHGLNVIPSFNGGDAESFKYCLLGLPKYSVLSCGNVGVSHSSISVKLWKCLVEKVVRELEPTALIIYGTKIEFEHRNDLKIYWHEDYIHSKLRKLYGGHKFYTGQNPEQLYHSEGETAYINGLQVKVIAKIGEDDHHSGLPFYSKTSDVYLKIEDHGKEVEQAIIYVNRKAVLEFDWGHAHRGKNGSPSFQKGEVHVHEIVEKNGVCVRSKKQPRKMTAEEISKYGAVIKYANSNVKM